MTNDNSKIGKKNPFGLSLSKLLRLLRQAQDERMGGLAAKGALTFDINLQKPLPTQPSLCLS